MDRVLRGYSPVYHEQPREHTSDTHAHVADAHSPHRRPGIAWLLQVPFPWLVKRCRTCRHSWPCPSTVRSRLAAGVLPAWMTASYAASLRAEQAEADRVAHLQGRRVPHPRFLQGRRP